jgi:hypothetical protein
MLHLRGVSYTVRTSTVALYLEHTDILLECLNIYLQNANLRVCFTQPCVEVKL